MYSPLILYYVNAIFRVVMKCIFICFVTETSIFIHGITPFKNAALVWRDSKLINILNILDIIIPKKPFTLLSLALPNGRLS